MKRLAFFTVALLIVPTIGWAVPDTPGAQTAVQVQPYENGFGNSTSFVSAMTAKGYVITEARTDPGPTAPDFDLWDYTSYLGSGFGVFWIEGHGNTGGHGVETYEISDTGLQSRDNNWNMYLAHGASTDHIYRGTSADGHSIGVRAAGVSNWFSSSSTAVINKTCSSTGYTSSWTGSRVHIGFSGNSVSDEAAFFGALESGNTFTDAKDGLMVLSGNGDTILRPDVSSCSSNYGDLIPEGGLDVTWTFNGSCSGDISVSGPAYACNQSWTNSSTFTARLCPLPGQTGQVWAEGNFTSGNGIPTYHSTNNWGFFVGTNSAADLSFGIRDGTAIWRVGSEYNTEGYQVEMTKEFSSKDEDWQALGPLHENGALLYEMDVSGAIADGYNWFRLKEKESSGNWIIHEYRQPATTGASPQAPARPRTLEYYLQAIDDHQSKVSGDMGMPADIGDGEKICIYTVPAFASAINDNYASFCRTRGYEVEIVTVDGYPQTAAEEDSQVNELTSLIATKAAEGAKYHEIWGRDNDYHYMHGERWVTTWTGSWAIIHDQMDERYVSTADSVVIPAPTVLDPLPRGENLAYWWPYFRSDTLYEPDGAIVTRVPVSQLWQVAAYSLIFQETTDFWSYPSYGMGMGLYVGNLDHMIPGDGALAQAAADTTRGRIQADGHWLVEIYENEHPNPELRNMHLANVWNGSGGGRTNLVFMFASISGPHYPGNMYSKRELGDYVWTMDLVHPYLNHHPMFIAPTCGTATAWATDDGWYYGSAVVIDMMFDEAGSIGYYGPSCGSLTSNNKEFGYVVADYVLSDLNRPVFESIALAEDDLAARFADNPRIQKQLLTMSKIGSSVTRLGMVDAVVSVEDGQLPQPRLNQNYPNPFNPVTKISFSTEKDGQVQLKVFDLAGRLVKTVVDDKLVAGPHHYSWNGCDNNGQEVASGLYFYQLRTDDYSLTKKMTLLK